MKSSNEILKASGLRMTEVRKKVLGLFLDSKNALSLPAIESSFEKLDRITLYRTLKAFEAKGLYIKQLMGPTIQNMHCAKKKLMPESIMKITHISIVLLAKKPFVLNHLPVPNIPILAEGYVIKERNLILSGICPNCG